MKVDLSKSIVRIFFKYMHRKSLRVFTIILIVVRSGCGEYG